MTQAWLLIAVVFVAACGRSNESALGGVKGALTVREVGFATPASVHHDALQDVYFVSNVNGPPLAEDGNGFISVLAPRGDTLALRWIDGAVSGVALHAPKGLVAIGQFLYVTDIATVRRFDRRVGEVRAEFPVPGATYLNGIGAEVDGTIYFTDTGLQAGPTSLLPSGTDAIYRLRTDGTLDTLIRDGELGQPTGIAVVGDTVWVVNRRGELYRVEDGRRADVSTVAGEPLHGLVVFGGDAFMTSEEGGRIYRGPLRGPHRELLAGLRAPSGVGHDEWRARLLIALSRDGEVGILPLVDPSIVAFPD